MDIHRAKEIVRTLADGIDPTTGEVLPHENVYNTPEVIRALFTLLEALNGQNTEIYVPVEAVKEELDPLRNAGKLWTDIEDDKLRDGSRHFWCRGYYVDTERQE